MVVIKNVLRWKERSGTSAAFDVLLSVGKVYLSLLSLSTMVPDKPTIAVISLSSLRAIGWGRRYLYTSYIFIIPSELYPDCRIFARHSKD